MNNSNKKNTALKQIDELISNSKNILYNINNLEKNDVTNEDENIQVLNKHINETYKTILHNINNKCKSNNKKYKKLKLELDEYKSKLEKTNLKNEILEHENKL